jgi:hypothetical protein
MQMCLSSERKQACADPASLDPLLRDDTRPGRHESSQAQERFFPLIDDEAVSLHVPVVGGDVVVGLEDDRETKSRQIDLLIDVSGLSETKTVDGQMPSELATRVNGTC